MYYPALFKLLGEETENEAGNGAGAQQDDLVKLDDDGSEAEYEEYHDDEYEQDEDELRARALAEQQNKREAGDDDESETDMNEEQILDIAEECFKRINEAIESYSITITQLFENSAVTEVIDG